MNNNMMEEPKSWGKRHALFIFESAEKNVK